MDFNDFIMLWGQLGVTLESLGGCLGQLLGHFGYFWYMGVSLGDLWVILGSLWGHDACMWGLGGAVFDLVFAHSHILKVQKGYDYFRENLQQSEWRRFWVTFGSLGGHFEVTLHTFESF